MEIISTPAPRSSAYREALFTLSASASETIDLDIREHTQGNLLGKKRLSGQSSYSVNVSNYAQRCLEVVPARGSVTFFSYPEKRIAAIRIQSGAQQSSATLISGLEPILFFEKLSNTPHGTPITPEQGDEISLYTDDSIIYAEVVLDPESKNKRIRLAEKGKKIGLCSLYLCMAHVGRRIRDLGLGKLDDYTSMELQLITEYDERVFSRKYVLGQPSPRTMRLCWWNRYGQIDYYTFKQAGTTRINVDKQRVYTPQGYKTTGCRTETIHELVSDYLNEEGMRWLQEMAAAPKAWIDNGETFLPVEILTREVVVAEERLARMEISITPSQKQFYQHL